MITISNDNTQWQYKWITMSKEQHLQWPMTNAWYTLNNGLQKQCTMNYNDKAQCKQQQYYGNNNNTKCIVTIHKNHNEHWTMH